MLSRLASRSVARLGAPARSLATTSKVGAIDLGVYATGYRWHPYNDPMMTFQLHLFGFFFWSWMFYHVFYDGDHHLPFNGSTIRPLTQSQFNKLFCNEELGLPALNPNQSIIGAVSL